MGKGRFLTKKLKVLGFCLGLPFFFPQLVGPLEAPPLAHHESQDARSCDDEQDRIESEYHEHEHQHSPDEAPHSHEHNHSSQTHSDINIAFSNRALDVAPPNAKNVLPIQQKSFASSGFFLGIFRPPIC